MTADDRQTPPVVDFPMSESFNRTRGREIANVEARLKARWDLLGIGNTLIANVWIWENRRAKAENAKAPEVTWSSVADWETQRLSDYFADEPKPPVPDPATDPLGSEPPSEPGGAPESPQ